MNGTFSACTLRWSEGAEIKPEVVGTAICRCYGSEQLYAAIGAGKCRAGPRPSGTRLPVPFCKVARLVPNRRAVFSGGRRLSRGMLAVAEATAYYEAGVSASSFQGDARSG